jgi:hypothetical protein
MQQELQCARLQKAVLWVTLFLQLRRTNRARKTGENADVPQGGTRPSHVASSVGAKVAKAAKA